MIYLDHNATTALDERVLEAMLPFLGNLYGNPSSLYRFGRIARSAINTAREQLAALIDAEAKQIVFTSGGTEANALAFANVGNGKVFISATEHPSVFENAQAHNGRLTVLPVETSGLLSLESLTKSGVTRGDFVSVMLANNETGVIQDVPAYAELLADLGATFHTDAVQALGKLPISFRQLGVKLMSLSSHKIYGPKGCGALVFSESCHLHPRQLGGDQEQGIRAGTENVAGIVGFGKAAEIAKAELAERQQKISALRDRLEQQLSSIPGLSIFAENSPRLPNTIQIGLSGCKGEMLLMQLDKQNICVSSGSACASASTEISPVLLAMQIDPLFARGAIRISLGKDNSELEIDQFVLALKKLLSIV